MQEIQFQSLGWEDPLEKEMATHSIFLPGEFHEQRSLADYSPWGRKESDMTDWLSYHTIWQQTMVSHCCIFISLIKNEVEDLSLCLFPI